MSLALAFNYFANSLWQVPLLALCCWCAQRIARASARVQYAVWILMLLLAVGLPVRGARPVAEVTVEVSNSDEIAAGAFLNPLAAKSFPFYAVRITPHTRDLLAELYLLMIMVCLLRLLMAYVTLYRLARKATVAAVEEPLRRALALAGIQPGRMLVLPATYGMPMVAGIVRPVVLLPAALLAGEDAALCAVLAHEAAHLRRRDTLVNLILRVVSLPIAYHPATMLVHRRIRHARELLCDAAAAGSLGSPNAYAQVLLRLAQQLVHTGGDLSSSTAGLFERTSQPLLEERIMNLIAPPKPLRLASRMVRFTAGAVVLGAAAATVCCVHLTPSVLAAEQPAKSISQAPVARWTPSTVPQATTTTTPLPPQSVAAEKSRPATSEQVDSNTAAVDLADAAAELRDPKLRLELQEAASTGVNTEALQKELDALRAQMNSPEFKREIAATTTQAMQAAKESAAYRKQMETMRKQLNSPEFKAQMTAAKNAAAAITAIDMQKLVAEAKAQAFLTYPAASQEPQAQRVSAGIMAGAVKSKVQPVYPPEAKAAGITGSVVMRAVIGEDGNVTELEVISGPPLLRPSALDAVRQWVYQPYLLNGQPTAVETTVTVTYSMGG